MKFKEILENKKADRLEKVKHLIQDRMYDQLAMYYEDFFDMWFDKKTFPERDYKLLVLFCKKHFKKWFDPKTFPDYEYGLLPQHLTSKFKQWYDPKTFPQDTYFLLKIYCGKYEKIWGKHEDKEYFKKLKKG